MGGQKRAERERMIRDVQMPEAIVVSGTGQPNGRTCRTT